MAWNSVTDVTLQAQWRGFAVLVAGSVAEDPLADGALGRIVAVPFVP